VVNLHWLLSQAQVTARPSVLWCYKKELGFKAKIKKEIKRGIRELNTEDPFELFISVTNIRYTYYKETHKILGNTYGMCVLQDFEALTPNLLARTIETVEGGGIIVLLLKTMRSLKQLYTLTMDVHSRYRTESHDDVIARFNERFILSLGSCENCLVVDDELNVLPISAGKNVKPIPAKLSEESLAEQQVELKELKNSLIDTQPIGCLVNTAKTLDQAKAILTFIEAISEKTLKTTITLTASRGRGKSAALGVAIASAIASGYSNIFVTSPSPENLKTLFEFIFKGFDALEYEEHLDYDIIQSTNPDFNKAIVRVNVFKQHRQIIQAEIVVIDEAAAIPLPFVKNLLGPYLIFMASTINGYEGTGRSLSLKLIQQLREQSKGFIGKGNNRPNINEDLTIVRRDGKSKSSQQTGVLDGVSAGGRILREIKLDEPIRYAPNDSVEKWLNKLLCLDATIISKNIQGCPHPQQCDLYYVNRDTLFSFHPVSETFLQRMMALYVASHYKNSPNDLQLMSDAPAHHLFVLLPPLKEGNASLPDPLCVIQVCLEGEISKQSILNSLSKGQRASGDLIPWLVSQQFQDNDFASLSGARIVRIATHPDYIKMGYGSRSIELLTSFYQGEFASLNENDGLDYLGVSYGLTPALHKFWKRAGFVPLYLRQTPNDLTGEYTCVMLKALKNDNNDNQDFATCNPSWLAEFSKDFYKRFLNLLSYQFRDFTSILALSIMEAIDISGGNIDADNREYYHVIIDLLPTISNLYFGRKLSKEIKLSGVQSSILLGIGLQRKSIDNLEKELSLPSNLKEAGNEVMNQMVEKQRELINSLDLSKYAITEPSEGWDTAESVIATGKKNVSTIVSVKNMKSTKKRKHSETAMEIMKKELTKQNSKTKGKKSKKFKKN
ncbi:11428_t:CDS:10, partial [Entrophospora sp. SA101]